MKNHRRWVAGLVSLYLIIGLSTHSLAQEQPGQSMINPTATEILKRMTDYIGNAKQFRVTTENTLEYILDSGHRIDIDVSADVIIKRPNKLQAERHGKLLDQIFYYDGKAITLYHPETNFYATEEVPDNYLELFRYMASTFGLVIPVSDLILEDAFQLLMEEVTIAAYLGRSSIYGVVCDQLFFSRPGVDFQVWVAVGEKPYPFKYVVTDTSSVDHLSIRTTLRNWDFNPEVKESDFSFVPPEGSQKIDFLLF